MQVQYELVRRLRESGFDDHVDTIHRSLSSLPVSALRCILPAVLVGIGTIPHGTWQAFTTEA